jgi:toxin ParE1/3/4
MSSRPRRLVVVRAARRDIRQIISFTAKTFGEAQAELYRNRIFSQLDLLAIHPELGRIREDVGHGVRSLLIEQHVVFYKASDIHVRVLNRRRSSRRCTLRISTSACQTTSATCLVNMRAGSRGSTMRRASSTATRRSLRTPPGTSFSASSAGFRAARLQLLLVTRANPPRKRPGSGPRTRDISSRGPAEGNLAI